MRPAIFLLGRIPCSGTPRDRWEPTLAGVRHAPGGLNTDATASESCRLERRLDPIGSSRPSRVQIIDFDKTCAGGVACA